MKVSTVLVFAAIALLGKCANIPKVSKNSGTKTVKNTSVKAPSLVIKDKENPTQTNHEAMVAVKHAKSTTRKVVSQNHATKVTKQDSANKAKVSIKASKKPLGKKLPPKKPSAARNESSTKVHGQKIVKTLTSTTKTNKKNKYWSPKSVIVPPSGDAILSSPVASNPILDKLYQERYEALEKVSMLNNKINVLINEKPTMDGGSESSFLSPGAFDSGSYRVQGGTVFLGPANAGAVVGMEDAKKRDESSSAGPVFNTAIDGPVSSPENPVDDSQSDSSAPADMPQPMDDQLVSSDSESEVGLSPNLTALSDAEVMAAVDDQLVLGDPEMFDSVCAVLKLTFEHTQGAMVLDDSQQTNNAELEDGAFVSNEEARSGLSLNLGEDGYMTVPGDFKGKPTKAAAISMWVNLKDVEGDNPLFQASENKTNHYDLRVEDGKLSWIHRDDLGKELFNVTVKKDTNITTGKWHHIVGAYSGKAKEATLWLDGKQVGLETGVSGPLSQNWDKVSMFKGKTSGIADNVFMFRCSLDRTKVVALYVAAASPKDAKRSRIPKVKPTH